MNAKIRNIHHIGHVVDNMEQALGLYRRLGFVCSPPSYPAMARREGEAPKPFGAANTHAEFQNNFIEIVTVVDEGKPLPADSHLVPLQAPQEVLPDIIQKINRTVATVSQCLSRYEGMHILCFHSTDVPDSADRLLKLGMEHSGAIAVQQPVRTFEGVKTIPIHYMEIDGEDVREGRLAIAENPPDTVMKGQEHLNHPNGAIELVEAILCADETELSEFLHRYEQYLECSPVSDGPGYTFVLERAQIRIIPTSKLAELLSGETIPASPGFAGYGVAVRDITATLSYLEARGIPVMETSQGDLFVPASSALGCAIIFKQFS